MNTYVHLSGSAKKPHGVILGILIFTVFFSVFFAIAKSRNSDRFQELIKQDNPDAIQYVQLASNIATKKIYSRHPDAIGEPDILRTPVYPLFIIASQALNNPSNLYIAQGILTLVSIFLTYRIGSRIGDQTTGMIAATFLSTDILILTSCFEAMSEIVFLFITLLSLEVLKWPINCNEHKVPTTRIFLGGLLLGLSTLTRPSNLYLPLVLFACHLYSTKTNLFSLQTLRYPAMIVLSGTLVLMPWYIRNYHSVGIARLTTIDKHNLIYFVGAGALQAKHGWNRQQAQQQIEKEYEIPSYSTLQNPWDSQEQTTKELYDSVKDKAVSIALAEPAMLIKSSVIGITKASLAHSAGSASQLIGGEWRSVRNINASPYHLVCLFVLQMIHTLILLFLCFVTLVINLKNRFKNPHVTCLYLMLSYYYLIMAMFGIDAVARSRISCMPFIAILAATAIQMAIGKLKIAPKETVKLLG